MSLSALVFINLVAAASEPRQQLEDALLSRALGNYETAQSRLLMLSNRLAADDPVRGWALYWLATSRLERNQPDAARDSLRECIRNGPTREICEDLLSQIELEASAIQALPTLWTFDGPHGIVLPGKGRMMIDSEALHWTSPRDLREPGTLLFGVKLPPGTEPNEVHLTLTSLGQDAWFGVVFVDIRGRVFPAVEGIQRIIADQPTLLRANLHDGPKGLLPSELDRVVFRDMSGINREGGEATEWVIDDLGLR